MATRRDLATSALTNFRNYHLPQRLHAMIHPEEQPNCNTLGSHSKQGLAWQCMQRADAAGHVPAQLQPHASMIIGSASSAPCVTQGCSGRPYQGRQPILVACDCQNRRSHGPQPAVIFSGIPEEGQRLQVECPASG